MAEVLTTRIAPVEGLVNYTLFTKPYHTKIIEVLVEYLHFDCIDVSFGEDFWISVGMPDPSILSLWGWSLEEAKKQFNCDFQSFQICEVNTSSGYFDIVGDYGDKFSVGDKILVQTDQLQFTQFTVGSISTSSQQLTTSVNPQINVDCGWTATGSPADKIIEDPGRTIQCRENTRFTGTEEKTRINVTETISPTFPSTGIIFSSNCWSYDSETNIYQFLGGIVWPSLRHVEKNINCGGYGTIWDSVGTGSPAIHHPLGVVNAITGGDAVLGYLEINNTSGVPAIISSWEDAFKYGVKFQIINSTHNDGEYTVHLSYVVYAGTPEVATNTLRIYVVGNLPSGPIDGDLQIIPWGYDEPRLCVERGQDLTAHTAIAENLTVEINSIGVNIIQGWDMQFWDVAGFDGGSFTYSVAFS
jgi:hypothetical protein